MSAPDSDVIHSWWIPALGGKIDAIPGRTNETWFEADREGVVHRPVRRALRPRARANARVGRRRCHRRRSTRGSTQQRDAQNAPLGRARAGGVDGRVRQVSRARTARAASARGSPEPPRSPTPSPLANLVRNGKGADARRRRRLDGRAGRRRSPLYLKESPPSGNAGRVRYPPGSGARSRAGSSRRTTSGSGSSTSRRSLVFLILAGLMALGHAHCSWPRRTRASSGRSATTSSSRSTGRRWSSSSASRSSPASRTTSCRS